MSEKLMRWERTESDKLALSIKDDGVWINYKKHRFYQPDFELSSKSGFRTAQYLLKLGYVYENNQ